MALGHRIRHQRILRLQIENVVFVDAGRHDHQWPLVHLGSTRCVLDELYQLVLEHHLTGSGGDVVADLEGGLVGHRDLALGDIGEKQASTFDQTRPATVDGFLNDFGIGDQAVRRADRVVHLTQDEVPLRLGALVHGCCFERAVRHRGELQIGLGKVCVAWILLPGLTGETTICAACR